MDVVTRHLRTGDRKVDEVLKIRLMDKVRAIEIAMKHLGIAGLDQHQVSGDEELIAALQGAKRRTARLRGDDEEEA